MQSTLRILKIAFLFFLVLVIALGGYFLATFPGAYKMCTTIKFVDSPPSSTLNNSDSFIDVRNVISKIPYQRNPETVYVPKPELKYRQTIVDGRGNCSNMSFGLSYRLLQEGHSFQIVHILSRIGFLKGIGHTVMNVPYELDGEHRYGIIDVHNAGIPRNNGKPLVVDQLRSGRLDQPDIHLLNSGREPQLTYYGKFLDESALAVIESEEIESYFKFMDNLYFSLGSYKVEKYLFETISFALGTYPNLYVANSDYDRLFAGSNKYIRYLALTLTWSIRVLMVIGPALVVAGIWNRWQRFRFKKKKVTISEKASATKEIRKHKESSKKRLVAVVE